jgi:hypothetical protein
MTTGSRKQTIRVCGLAPARMKKFWSGQIRETRRNGDLNAVSGRGRRFNSDRPHQNQAALEQKPRDYHRDSWNHMYACGNRDYSPLLAGGSPSIVAILPVNPMKNRYGCQASSCKALSRLIMLGVR